MAGVIYRMQENTWYAAEILEDGLIHGGHRYSPIRVEQVTPLKTGNRIFELRFFHANYPAGVQDKTYRLQTVHAGEEYILARSVDGDPPRFMLIHDIRSDWMRKHFQIELTDGEAPEDWLNREFSIR
jgi:hypothetical protein